MNSSWSILNLFFSIIDCYISKKSWQLMNGTPHIVVWLVLTKLCLCAAASSQNEQSRKSGFKWGASGFPSFFHWGWVQFVRRSVIKEKTTCRSQWSMQFLSQLAWNRHLAACPGWGLLNIPWTNRYRSSLKTTLRSCSASSPQINSILKRVIHHVFCLLIFIYAPDRMILIA